MLYVCFMQWAVHCDYCVYLLFKIAKTCSNSILYLQNMLLLILQEVVALVVRMLTKVFFDALFSFFSLQRFTI
jgi:hypothetical protein